jgi:hypothetical protein
LQSAIPRSKISKQQRSKLGILTAESPSHSHAIKTVQYSAPELSTKSRLRTTKAKYIHPGYRLRALQLLADGRPASSYHVPIQLLRYANPRMKAALEASMSSPNHRHLKEKWQDGWRDLIRERATLSRLSQIALSGMTILFSEDSPKKAKTALLDSLVPELYPLIRAALRIFQIASSSASPKKCS